MGRTRKMSHNEQVVYEHLQAMFPHFNIRREYSLQNFPDCPKPFRRMRLDFYIPELNLAIEVDGEHHKQVVRYDNALKAQVAYERRRILDLQKEMFLREQGVKFIRLSADEIDDINTLKTYINDCLSTQGGADE